MVVRVCTSFDELPQAWDTLMDMACKQNFFFGREWFTNFVQTTLYDGIKPRIYGVEDSNGRPRMVLAMQAPSAQAGSIIRSNIKRQGSLSSLSNFQSCEYGPALPKDDDPAEAIYELAQYLHAEDPAWTFIEINSLDRDSTFFRSAITALQRSGFVVGTRFHFGNMYDQFDKLNYAEYLKQRDGRARKAFKNYSRKGRKLERKGKVEYRLFVDDADIDTAIADYDAIHKASWKQSEQGQDFVPGVLRTAARLGRLRMGILYYNGVAVATEVGVLSGRRATMIKTAYDKRYSDYSVGAVVMMRVLEHLVDTDQVSEIDFGRDDQDYKRLWLPRRRERWAIVAFNPRKLDGVRPMPGFFSSTLIDRFAEWTRPWAKPILQQLQRRK